MNANEHCAPHDEVADLQVLSTEQYAALAGVTVHAVYAERRRGTGPKFIRLGDPLVGRCFYLRRDVVEHLRRRWERAARSTREEVAQSPELADRRAKLAERAYRNLEPHWRRRGVKAATE